MSRKNQIFWALTLLAAVYLFATRPPPLDMAIGSSARDQTIPIRAAFNTVDAINARARTLYTARIVGAGMKAGLKFGEDWATPGADQGPLPALFLRLVAERLEAKAPPLGLYLGSDAPINKSNLFEGQEAIAFQTLRAQLIPSQTLVAGVGAVGLYPDFASAQPCVTCHNEHPDSPKTDWKRGDVMGATTWTYPSETLSRPEFHALLDALYAAIGESYQAYLDKSQTFADPPTIGRDWPEIGGRVLPSLETFTAELKRETALEVLNGFVLLKGAPDG